MSSDLVDVLPRRRTAGDRHNKQYSHLDDNQFTLQHWLPSLGVKRDFRYGPTSALPRGVDGRLDSSEAGPRRLLLRYSLRGSGPETPKILPREKVGENTSLPARVCTRS